LLSIIGPPSNFYSKHSVSHHVIDKNNFIVASDASAFGIYAYSVRAPLDIEIAAGFSEAEMHLSSGHRELIAVSKFLSAMKGKKQNRDPWFIYWLTDSSNLVVFLTKGSSVVDVQRRLFDILIACRDLNITIFPIHLFRSDPRIQIADEGSRENPSDDWGIDEISFQKLQNKFSYTLDVFASPVSYRLHRYFCLNGSPTAFGQNAFCHSWENEILWVCPPVSQIIPAIRRIRKLKSATGTLIVPAWETASFWPFLVSKDFTLPPFLDPIYIQPYIVQFQDVTDTALFGYTDFSIALFHF